MNALRNCPDLDVLQASLTDEASPNLDAMSDHLADCLSCQNRLESLALGDRAWLLDAAGECEILPSALIESLVQLGQTTTTDTVAQLETLDDPTLGGLIVPVEGNAYGRIGPYEVLGVVGRGGMGIVLQGFDLRLQRAVALKVPAVHLRNDVHARGRFLREARASAAITHANVVPIYAVEEYGGVPVLVMAYIHGESLQQRLDRDGRFSFAETLRIGISLAEALEAAHEKGLVHRDVKPGNVLLEDLSDEVRLTDFGLARAADDARLTQTGLGAGTPLYMSPEQARGESVDHRADLFALGSVLYTLLAGQSPFVSTSLMGTLRRISDGAPDSLRTLVPTLPRHLETLIMDLLTKDPNRRPSSARIVIDRLRQSRDWLAAGVDDPAQIRRRRRGMRLAVLACLLCGITAIAGTTLRFTTPDGTLVVDIEDPNAKVIVDRDGKEVTISGVGIQEIKLKLGEQRVRVQPGAGPMREEIVTITRDGKAIVKATFEPITKAVLGDPIGGGPVFIGGMGGSLPTVPVNPQVPIRTGFISKIDDPAGQIRFREVRSFQGHTGPVRGLAITPDGKTLVSTSTWPAPDHTVRIWDVATGQERLAIGGPPGDIPTVILSKGGSEIVVGGQDGKVYRWDLASGKLVKVFAAHPGHLIVGLAQSGEGVIATGAADGVVKVWGNGPPLTLMGHSGRVRSLAFSPDGKLLLAASETGEKYQPSTVRLWDLETGRVKWVKTFERGWIERVMIMPDGKRYLACGPQLTLGDLATGASKIDIQAHLWGENGLALSPDGRIIATTGNDGFVRLWTSDTLQPIAQTLASQGNGLNVIFSPDGKNLFVAGGGRFNPTTQVYQSIDISLRQWAIEPTPQAFWRGMEKLSDGKRIEPNQPQAMPPAKPTPTEPMR